VLHLLQDLRLELGKNLVVSVLVGVSNRGTFGSASWPLFTGQALKEADFVVTLALKTEYVRESGVGRSVFLANGRPYHLVSFVGSWGVLCLRLFQKLIHSVWHLHPGVGKHLVKRLLWVDTKTLIVLRGCYSSVPAPLSSSLANF